MAARLAEERQSLRPAARQPRAARIAASLAADDRARPLRPRAAELPLLERRLVEEREQARAKQELAKAAREIAASHASDREALTTAQASFESADKTLAEAADQLKVVEDQALRDSSEVQAARESLEQARKQGIRLKIERLELRYRSAAAELLKDYNLEAQRRAYPHSRARDERASGGAHSRPLQRGEARQHRRA